MSEAYFSGDAIVTLGAAGAAASAAANVTVTTYITNFNVSGGETDTEVINVFGNGNIHKRSPRGEYEVSFDFIMRGDAGSVFELAVAGSTLSTTSTSVIDMSTLPQESVVYVELKNEDGDTFKAYGFNNALCTTYEAELGADDHATGSVTFKVPAKTEAGATNVKGVTDSTGDTSITW